MTPAQSGGEGEKEWRKAQDDGMDWPPETKEGRQYHLRDFDKAGKWNVWKDCPTCKGDGIDPKTAVLCGCAIQVKEKKAISPGEAQYNYIRDLRAKYGVYVAPWDSAPASIQIQFENSARVAIKAYRPWILVTPETMPPRFTRVLVVFSNDEMDIEAHVETAHLDDQGWRVGGWLWMDKCVTHWKILDELPPDLSTHCKACGGIGTGIDKDRYSSTFNDEIPCSYCKGTGKSEALRSEP